MEIVAAICWGLGKAVTIEDIQVDPPKSKEVRVKMLCASLCHTDISSTQGFPHVCYLQFVDFNIIILI